MGICKRRMRLVFGEISDGLRYLNTMQRTKERPVQGPDYGRLNSKHCEIKIIRQRNTDRAHHKGLHDKWWIGIITRTAESFLGCHMVLLSKSHVSKNFDTHKTVPLH